MSHPPELKTLSLKVDGHIAEIALNRPDKGNAMNPNMFVELEQACQFADEHDDVRVILLHAHGDDFTFGLDLTEAMSELGPHLAGGLARKRQALRQLVLRLQRQTGAYADATKPVVAAVHGWCIGGGVDLVAACDIRLCSADARFSVRETKMAIVADLGSLQRLPRIIGDAATRELALTGKDIDAERALQLGLVSQVHETPEQLLDAARAECQLIADNSPVTVQGVKHILNAQDGRTIAEGLDYVATWNSAFLASADLGEAISAFMERRKPAFGKE